MAKATDKIQITLDSGASAEAQAPVIVSASRSTDIPAFYADWFFERLKRGYSAITASWLLEGEKHPMLYPIYSE